jgi:hypothetical protein
MWRSIRPYARRRRRVSANWTRFDRARRLPDQTRCETSADEALAAITVNALSVVSLTIATNLFSPAAASCHRGDRVHRRRSVSNLSCRSKRPRVDSAGLRVRATEGVRVIDIKRLRARR